ncbi:acetoin utilization protein AcuC [Phaeacidiphilus oryzae]|uniref:acetoin utilization protein AcuC n=1 Tax=Phaeacidiphilus oryzae TaxID=348818 RepID=UPI0006901E18|nr:acetoin utilization protein AcuC [Phaeacidiphilus oryzae]
MANERGEQGCGLRLQWDEAVTEYDFGPEHPMHPARLHLTMRLIREFGLDRAPGVRVEAAPPAGDSTLRLVHHADYLDAVRSGLSDPRRGLGTEDNPLFPNMHRAAALIAGQSVAAAEAVYPPPGTPADRRLARHAVNFTGGLHHAMPSRAAGFCIYNDAAVAIARLLELGAERVAYVDTDVHHGDGVQHVFWHDPRVLTISLHEDPRFLFPHTGRPEESGGPGAEGMAVNVALPPGTRDAGWLRAFHAVVPQLLAAFQPQVLVTQHGADAHVEDPLADLAISVDAQATAAAELHEYAHTYAGGRWVALGGGGYAVAEVVPRVWTHLVGIAAGRPVAPEEETPEPWRAEVRRLTGREAPKRMTDGVRPTWREFEDYGYDPADRLDRAIIATRREIFPLHGLLPEPF